MKTVDFIYDVVSPASYLAWTQIPTLLPLGHVALKPVFLGGLMKLAGNVPPGTVPAKGAYFKIDWGRYARRYGVVMRWPEPFPMNTANAMRLIVACPEEKRMGLTDEFFQRVWTAGEDITSPEVLRAALLAQGLDVEPLLAAMGSDAIKAELMARTEAEAKRGAFGAPTFFVGDDMFFGNDRLDFVREALAA